MSMDLPNLSACNAQADDLEYYGTPIEYKDHVRNSLGVQSARMWQYWIDNQMVSRKDRLYNGKTVVEWRVIFSPKEPEKYYKFKKLMDKLNELKDFRFHTCPHRQTQTGVPRSGRREAQENKQNSYPHY